MWLCLLVGAETSPSTNMTPSKTFHVAFVTKCVGQPVGPLSAIKLNMQIIRLLLKGSPVVNVEWLAGLMNHVIDNMEIIPEIIIWEL